MSPAPHAQKIQAIPHPGIRPEYGSVGSGHLMECLEGDTSALTPELAFRFIFLFLVFLLLV